MIPYALSIHGVRDFPTRRILLGESDDHVLITGPNGVGKSTLTFCIGAILYSAKVELSGLRSNNLPENEPWHAHMSLLFKNEGPTKIDGPKFISFELIIRQDGIHSLPRREYRIVTGDSEDELTDMTIYTSGHTGGRNFGAYKEDLQHKYKIDPDLYYLVWYQQEVNQFASMNPEERFRKFSDMFNITNMQQEWEAALERVKEVEQEIKDLNSTVKSAKYSLNIAANERNNFLNNRKRIIANGQKHFTYTTILIEKYKKDLIEIDQTIRKLQSEKNKFAQTARSAEENLAERIEDEASLANANSILQEVIDQHDEQIKMNEAEINKIEVQVNVLNEQLVEVQEKAKRLRYDEATTLEKYDRTNEKLTLTKEKMKQLKEREASLNEEAKTLIETKTTLNYNIEKLREKITSAKQKIAQYKSSYHIQGKIEKLQEKHESLRNENNDTRYEIDGLKQTIEQLRQNKVISHRQQEGLADLQRNRINAYTLRDLVELSPQASLKLEDQLATIKYTVFYDAKTYTPINDLYYVSLKQIVPDKVINNLPTLGLQIRRNLPENLLNHANKALWWIEQFFTSLPRIENNILIDERGKRGAQETKQYILSDVAIQRMLDENKEKLTKLTIHQKSLTEALETTTNRIREMHGLMHSLQEAERDVLEESKMNNKQKELQLVTERLDHVNDTLNEIEIERDSLYKENYQLEMELENLQIEIRIHEELGELAEQQIEREKLLEKIKGLEQKNYELRSMRDTSRQKRDENSRIMSDTKQVIRRLKDEIANAQSSLSRRKNRLEELEDKREQRDTEISNHELKLEELISILPEEAQRLDETVNTSVSENTLLTEISKASIELENARTEKVNENAVENYEKIKEDYDQKNSELTKSVILFEENEKRAKETENQLETTINMYLTKINNLFQAYMNEFQFEGVIDKERIEEKSGRIKYLLYVKARKIGHQGALEDVSLKARHGKVGKGVSGGEESLSSLLFALALMQNLDISPSYIVLDEFDSALDDERKHKVFELYHTELKRKLIIISPKAHDEIYYNYFREVIVIEHDSSIPQSNIKQIRNKEKRDIQMNYIKQTNL